MTDLRIATISGTDAIDAQRLLRVALVWLM